MLMCEAMLQAPVCGWVTMQCGEQAKSRLTEHVWLNTGACTSYSLTFTAPSLLSLQVCATVLVAIGYLRASELSVIFCYCVQSGCTSASEGVVVHVLGCGPCVWLWVWSTCVVVGVVYVLLTICNEFKIVYE